MPGIIVECISSHNVDVFYNIYDTLPGMPNNKTLSSLSLLILLGFIWGTGYSIARFAMTNGVHPFGYSFWQSLGPAIFISLICLIRRSNFELSRQHLLYYFISGLTGIVIPNTCMYFAASHLPAGIMAMIVNTVPIIAYPMALFIGLEYFNWQRMFGIMVAFCGLMLIVIPKSSLPEASMSSWVFITLITPISFAVSSIFIAHNRPKDMDSISLAAGMLIASSFTLIPIVILTHSFYVFNWPLTSPDWVILLEILLSSVGYLLFFKLIQLAGPVYYSLVDTVVVLTGVFWGHIIFSEHLNVWTSSAVFLILIALVMVTSQQRKAALNLS